MNYKDKPLIIWFKDLSIKDVPLVGGKNASLGEMYRTLMPKGINIPNGFAVTAAAYFYFIESAGIKGKIKEILQDLNAKNLDDLYRRSKKVRSLIYRAKLPDDLKKEIIASYKKLSEEFKQPRGVDVAIRSSATAEDLPNASFAGQQDTYLNVQGEKELIKFCKECFASLFTPRAIVYREEKHFDHFKVGLSIGVQKMVRSDLASAGIMFSLDTETGFRNVVLINSIYGLGENIVQGQVTPDEFLVFKPTFEKGYPSIIFRKVGKKSLRMVYTKNPNRPVKNTRVPKKEQEKFSITDKEVLTLAKWALEIEKHYGKPMDIEWAKDGKTKQLYIVQARPETVQSQRDWSVLEEYRLLEKKEPIVVGSSVGFKIGKGEANVIKDVSEIKKFKKGQVLVTDMTDPDWVPIMKMAAAIVTNKGGRTCHAAIVSRELNIPCVVGTGEATEKIKSGQKVTVSCAEGDEGHVYDGLLKTKVIKHNLKNIKRPKTKIMMNIGNPEIAFTQSFVPNDGVGLAREEFIVNNYIKAHPLALLNFDKLAKEKKLTKEEIKEIQELTKGYKNKKEFFIDKLASGVAIIAAAFYPKDVIVRLSDFKTNEYANLIGGRLFEPKEDNPMLGWRGASRYYSKEYKAAFVLECRALARARQLFGLTNIKVMVPFCRTVEEGKKVIDIMAKNGLARGKDNLEIYVMCEIPSNVILFEEFAQIFDGFSIGSNDLTQLTLGVDRDSSLVSHIYDERNLAVKALIKWAISSAKKYKRKIGICGQAPSDFPDFAAFLVDCGIDSISLNPDTVIKTTLRILEEEKKKKK